MSSPSPDVTAQAIAWLADDPDPATVGQLRAQLAAAQAGDAAAQQALATEFAGPLTFGTAGLRAPMGPGPARMNRVVVTRAAAGFAAWLVGQGVSSGPVLVGYDARHNSEQFARDTAEILAGAGFDAMITDGPTPTPVVVFGIGHFGCVAAIVVTASHNPGADNGFKVYLGDGSQIIPPTDTEISAHIAQVAAEPISRLRRGGYRQVGDDLVSAYARRAGELVHSTAPRDVRWVYTAMHGVGAATMARVVTAAGFPSPRVVAEQAQPDAEFPTVPFPNPEEPGAMDLAIALGRECGADVAIASDPDADRCAAAAPIHGQWRLLSGDELGWLLGDEALRRGVHGSYACSIVSSTLLGVMAAAHGQPFANTLTGFKWIGRVPDLVFGYEEAIGYCCDPAWVRDKDGLTAMVLVLRLVAELKAIGQTLGDRLDELALRYGLYSTNQLAFRVSDMSVIHAAMSRLRDDPPQELGGEPVTFRDLATLPVPTDPIRELPPTDAVEFTGPRTHVVVRPSGTEPKLKCYLEVRIDPTVTRADLPGARRRGDERIQQLRSQLSAVLGL